MQLLANFNNVSLRQIFITFRVWSYLSKKTQLKGQATDFTHKARPWWCHQGLAWAWSMQCFYRNPTLQTGLAKFQRCGHLQASEGVMKNAVGWIVGKLGFNAFPILRNKCEDVSVSASLIKTMLFVSCEWADFIEVHSNSLEYCFDVWKWCALTLVSIHKQCLKNCKLPIKNFFYTPELTI